MRGSNGVRKSNWYDMAARPKHLPQSTEFPKFKRKNHRVTSDEDPQYNCIAYAAGITNKKYWPGFHPDYYWPSGIPRTTDIASFIKLYESFGYSLVADGNSKFETGWEKIAVYASRLGVPTHAAKQMGADKWASKLGDSFDIEHQFDAVSQGIYGTPVVFMRRKIV